MKTFIIAYLSSIVPMLAIDAVWLFTMSKRFYAKRIGSLMVPSPKLSTTLAWVWILRRYQRKSFDGYAREC